MMISVIVPVYNREKTIKRALESLLSQNDVDIEIIVIDDKSTDLSVEIVKEMQKNNPLIKLIELENNSGACKARNVGIEAATGTYIAFNDSDDIFDSNKLKMQLDFLNKTKSDVVFCSYTLNKDNKKTVIPKLEKTAVKLNDLLKHSLISTQTILCKKTCLEDIKFDDKMPRFQDWDLAIRLSKKYKISFQNMALVDVYESENSISKSNAKGLKALKLIFAKYKKDFIKSPIALFGLLHKYYVLKRS